MNRKMVARIRWSVGMSSAALLGVLGGAIGPTVATKSSALPQALLPSAGNWTHEGAAQAQGLPLPPSSPSVPAPAVTSPQPAAPSPSTNSQPSPSLPPTVIQPMSMPGQGGGLWALFRTGRS